MVWTNAFTMSFSTPKLHTIRFNQLQRLLSLLCFTISLHHITITHAQVPADHLIPPPPPSPTPLLPIPQALTHNRPYDYSKRFEAHTIPLQRDVTQSHTGIADQTGLMTRIARWFGLAGSPQDQQLIAASFKHPAYSYPKPQEQFSPSGKAHCNLCNKYPWIPMMPLSVQYPPVQQHPQAYHQAQWNQQHAQASKYAPAFLPIAQTQQQAALKQRAVQLNFPKGYYGDISKLKSSNQDPGKTPSYISSSQPSLSGNALPPIFDSQPFRTPTSTFVPLSEQQLPTNTPAHFSENIGAHSELNPDQIAPLPTQIPPTVASQGSSNVEIIKSHQLTDFVSSIEYPATYVQSQSFDIAPQTQMPANHKPDTEVPTNTVQYQHNAVQPHTKNHIPASQLLTDPASLSAAGKSQYIKSETTYAPNRETYTTYKYDEKQEPPTTTNGYNHEVNPSGDNFPSASSHNNHNSFHLQSNEIYTTTEFPADTPHHTGIFSISERPQHTSSISLEFIPSVQIKEAHDNFRQNTKDRGTPKRLLDSPIQHISNSPAGSPRPFTRDPSDLNYRLGQLSSTQQSQQQFLNNAHILVQAHTTESSWLPTVTPAPRFPVASVQPTPTSTYGAIDASGQFAGMSPPVPLPIATKTVQQIIVPYTTKSRPRPFEPPHSTVESTTNDVFGNTYDRVNFPQHFDLHEQQESKVVISTATEIPTTPPTTRRTTPTKYITKVLAANLRELLRREQALKNRSNSNAGIDLKKLQKNIDDWTEQEYTSLSHRPSTPTIRGRSKHIPVEYLTTTTPSPLTKMPKTTQFFDSTALSTSINNLESLRTTEQGFHRGFKYPPIEHNLIPDSESVVTQATTTSTTTTKPISTTTKRPLMNQQPDKYTTPIYVRPLPTQPPPEVLWQKAKILISPDTKEKLYVVTPQPRFFPQRQLTTTSTVAPVQVSSGNRHKSPRFIVRPTPGNGSITSSPKPTSSQYAPDRFGLSGLSAFVPAEPVEIIDGNSKVITTVTPSAKPAMESEHVSTMSRSIRTDYVTIKRNHAKPTMSPSPR